MIFENPFKYRRKWERRKISRFFLWVLLTGGFFVLAIGTAMYSVTPPAPATHIIGVWWAVFEKEAFRKIQKNTEINRAFFLQNNETVPWANPDQELIDTRIRKLKKLPPLSDKSFLRTVSLSRGEADIENLKSHSWVIDIVFSDWFTLTPSGCALNESIDWDVFEELNKKGIATIPRFSNANHLWRAIDFSSFLANTDRWMCLIDALKQGVKNRSAKGVNIDVVNLMFLGRTAYTAWLLSLVESFHEDGLYVTVDVPMNNAAYDYENIGKMADIITIKAYDEHSTGGIPGPIAWVYWFEHSLEDLLKAIPPSKTIIALGLHGYDWNLNTSASPERRNFTGTMHLVENTSTQIKWDPGSRNNNFAYRADDGSYHEVWFLDAVSAWNQYLLVSKKQVHGVSFPWIDTVDRSFWTFFGSGSGAFFDPMKLHIKTSKMGRAVTLSGRIITNSSYIRLQETQEIPQGANILGISSGDFESIFLLGEDLWERLTLLWKMVIPHVRTWTWNFLITLFIVTTVVSLFRIVFLGYFVYRSHTYRKKHFSRKFLNLPPVTILVPAYNEEKVIERTILGLLKSDYPIFEILVIDDGSTDATALCVDMVAEKYPSVRLITKKNEGKSRALNLGFQEAKYDYVVTVDADTIVLPKTIYYLMEPFSNKSVDAVCGNIWVGNVKNILTAFQEVEYVTGQNFDRRAFDALNCISVVPGATGAWKKQKVLDIGGYSSDTLVEDADLTLTLLEYGGRIVYAPLARSVTEAPEMVWPLFKQRFRWSYGTFQCFWKHRKTFGKWTLGLIALPNMLFFQVIFPALSPIGDVVLFAAIFFGNLQPILVAYILFFLMDAMVSGAAYALDKRSLTNIWVICIQRFFYRQFMYIVTFKSIISALSWSHHGWNKLERKGTVKVMETG